MAKKIILPAIVTAIMMFAIGYASGQIFNFLFPALEAEYQDTYLFRPWTDPAMLLYFVHPFILGFILAWIWIKVKRFFEGSSAFSTGLQFGLAYWLLSLSGMIITYSTFPVSLLMVGSWTFGLLIESIAAGWLLAKLNPPGEQ